MNLYIIQTFKFNINFVASYNYGKNKSWKTDLRWKLIGFPFTQTQGFYEKLHFLRNNVIILKMET